VADFVADTAHIALQHRCWLVRTDTDLTAAAAALPAAATAAFMAADGVASTAPSIVTMDGRQAALPVMMTCALTHALHLTASTWSVHPLQDKAHYRMVVTADVPVPDASVQLRAQVSLASTLLVDATPPSGTIVELGDPADTSAAQQAADAVAESLAASSGDSGASTDSGRSSGVVSIDDVAAQEAAALQALAFHAFTTLDVFPLPIVRPASTSMTAPTGAVTPSDVVAALTAPAQFDLDYVTGLADVLQLYADVASSSARGITTPSAVAAGFVSGLHALDGSCQSALNVSLPLAWSVTDADSCVEWLAIAVGSDPSAGLMDDILPFVPIPVDLESASLHDARLGALPDGSTVYPVLTVVGCSGTATWTIGNGITLTESLSVDASGLPLVCIGAPGGGSQAASASDDFRARQLSGAVAVE
jgi:hypothetical protein